MRFAAIVENPLTRSGPAPWRVFIVVRALLGRKGRRDRDKRNGEQLPGRRHIAGEAASEHGHAPLF
jgi:hypothetical protein